MAIETRDPDQRAALVNEVLGDVGLGPSMGRPDPDGRGAAVGRGAPRGAVLLPRDADARALVDIVPVLAWGGAGVLGALAIGREADRVAPRPEAAVDAWVARVMDAAATVLATHQAWRVAPGPEGPNRVGQTVPTNLSDDFAVFDLVDPYQRDVYSREPVRSAVVRVEDRESHLLAPRPEMSR